MEGNPTFGSSFHKKKIAIKGRKPYIKNEFNSRISYVYQELPDSIMVKLDLNWSVRGRIAYQILSVGKYTYPWLVIYIQWYWS